MEQKKSSHQARADEYVQQLKDRFHKCHETSHIRFQQLTELLDKVGKQIELQRQASD